LAWWSLQVIRGQHLHRLVAIDVKPLCAFLLIHADYVAQWPKALADLESSAAELGVIAADNAPRHQGVGRCPGTNGDLPCTGMVTATVRRDDDKLPSGLQCNGTPSHSWPAGEWRTLNRRLRMDAGASRRETERLRSDMNVAAMSRLAAAIAAPKHL